MADRIAPTVGTTAFFGEKLALDDEVEALHQRCGVYTRPEIVCRILDAVGWRSKTNLARCRLLEPAAGDGAFVVEAARRLVKACIRHQVELRVDTLAGCMKAYELHPIAALKARLRVFNTLREMGVHHRTAKACANSWVVNADFLLVELPQETFTHVVGNPPYIRWSKIPQDLKAKYERRLSREMIGGDLFLPFLDKTLEALSVNGRCGFLCSDRWRYMAFAEQFRKKWLPRLDITAENKVSSKDAFVKNVDSYATILVATRRINGTPPRPKGARTRKKTLQELGCVVKVGPALGHTAAYVLEADENDVEQRLLRPWVDGSEIIEGEIASRGRRVVTLHDKNGKLLQLKRYARLKARLQRFRTTLQTRSIVENGAPWFRTIDRVRATDWTRPKLLVPELARVPRLAIDRSGRIPAHGVYAIFAPDDDVEALYEKLRDGKLATALRNIAPKVKGGYVRCYRRFLQMVRI